MRRAALIVFVPVPVLVGVLVLVLAGVALATSSTSYCLHGTMADGTYTRSGSAAHNGLALGTRIYVTPAPFGRHRWVVRDRIGYGTELDLWAPSCSQAIAYGRRSVSVRVGWPVKRVRWRFGLRGARWGATP